jgi:endonuclease YncB( thermonuclease family)
MQVFKYFVVATLFLSYPISSYATWGPYKLVNPVAIDGDTFKGMFQVFEGIWVQKSIRIRGVDTPETKSKAACERLAAAKAANFLGNTLVNSSIEIKNVDDDKYSGRVDADVLVNGKDLATVIIQSGNGRVYDGKKRDPWCKDISL